jgi:enediyne biosynthesis protein E4
MSCVATSRWFHTTGPLDKRRLTHAGSDDGVESGRRGFVRWRVLGLGLLVTALAAGTGASWMRERSRVADLEQVRAAMEARRFGVARERLARLAERFTNDGETLLRLGECELALGNRERALSAWARVASSSPFFGRAALLRATHLINSGRYTPAGEVLLESLSQPAWPEQFELERALSRLYRFEGRSDDVRRALRGSWSRAPNPAAILKELWFHDTTPVPVEALLLALEKADQGDDRVWLGRANQAILTGRFGDAAGWVDRCVARRPFDPAVWKARLDLAMATDDVPGFWAALERLPDDKFDGPAVHALRAWLASERRDQSLESKELTALLEGAPGNAKALERLSVLTFQAGKAQEAERLRRRKAEVDHAQGEVRKLMLDGNDLSSRAGLLAQFTRTLGRRFDAEAWAILADARLTDPPPVQAGDSAVRSSPLPDLLAARAGALCEPYAHPIAPKAAPVLALVNRLADLREKTSPGDTATAAPPLAPKSTLANPEFVDDAAAAGLRFVFDNGQTPRFLMPETNSGGVGLLDFDGDGWLDVYCVQGGQVISPAVPDANRPADGDRLFRNQRDGTFQDVTQASGVAAIAWGRGYGMGVTIGDFDNDGRPDLFVTRLQTYALYRNRGDGTFEDATERTGLAGRRDNPSSAAFADLDNDGDLDLYICHYMIWDPANPPVCLNEKGNYFYCSPQKVEPAPDHVFRNDGGRFIDVTKAAGFTDIEGRGLGVVAADIDDDNRIDIYVANDGTANYLFHNQGDFRFEEMGLEAGVAGSAEGGYRAGMGVACGDMDGDGRPDLMVTNFYGEGVTFHQNLGQGLFADRSAASGIGLATRYLLGFGVAMVDVTNDGRPDVMITNGHVNDNRPYYLYAMPSRLYENRPDGRFVDVSSRAGPPWAVERVGRGLAAGDLDNDGLVDAVILAQNEPVAFFHNRTRGPGRFVTFQLEGTKSNRDGVGARVTINAGGRRQVAQRQGGGSYQSAQDPRLHFGLGESDRVETVEVRWPSGKIDRWTNLAADTGHVLREGHSTTLPLAGFSRKSRSSDPRPIK